MSRASTKLSHDQLERFVTDVLSKREPCPAMVLAWGWACKQGEGGIFHNDTFKQRYFVLARVPHATVLIYYGQKCMDEEHILGYIDLRKVISVRETSKVVALDANLSKASAMMNRLKGLVGAAPPPEGSPRPVIELITSGRTFVLAAASILMPKPMTTSMAISGEVLHKPLYLFGWPFPVPPMDEQKDEARIAEEVAQGAVDSDAFSQWRDVMATAVAAEKATRVFPVMTLVDSSAQLPQRVLLRTTPCELAVISVEDKDLCFTALPYNDLLKWEVPLETELHVTARTRSRLVSRPDRSGFNAQRPTRRTCHYVFKTPAARAIVGVIDNHLRALARQLGATGEGGGDAGGSDAYGDAAAEYESRAGSGGGGDDGGGDAEEEESGKKAAKKLTARRGGYADDASPAFKAASARARTAAADEGDEEEEDEDEEEERTTRRPVSSSSGGKRGVAGSSSSGGGKARAPAPGGDEGEEDDEDARPRAKAPAPKKAPVADSDDEDEEAAAAARRKAKAAAAKKAAQADDDDDDDDAAAAAAAAKKKKAAAAAKKAAAAADEDSE